MTFSIIVPAYNEFETLEHNIPILAGRFPSAEILLIENGTNIAPNFDYLRNVREIHSKTAGLGIGLKTGLLFAKNKAAIFLPADLSYGLDFVEQGSYLVDKGSDLVIGSKAVSMRADIQRPLYRKLVSYFYNLFYSIVYDLHIGDITGVKAYNRDTILPLVYRCKSDGIFFEVELLRQMRKEHMRILEIPVKVNDMRKGAFGLW